MTDTHLVNTSDQPIAAVSGLATDVADVANGYKTLVERAEGDLRPIAERLQQLHSDHASELLNVLSKIGGNPETVGSAMESVHKTVLTLRDWVGALDKSAIKDIRDGEEQILSSYEDAAGQTAGHPHVHDLIISQRDALRAEVARLSD